MSDFEKMIAKLKAMTDEELVTVWQSVCNEPFDRDAMYSGDISMETWVEHIYSEMGLIAISAV